LVELVQQAHEVGAAEAAVELAGGSSRQQVTRRAVAIEVDTADEGRKVP